MSTESCEPTVGVIGLGVMGKPIAGHLLRSLDVGRVFVSSRRATSAMSLRNAGAQWSATPRELATEAAIVIVVVPDLPELREVLLGDEGLIHAARDHVVVVHSTCSPDGLRELQRECDARSRIGRIALVDAPVSGGEEGARAGHLSIMVGGDDTDIARVEPALRAYGSVRRFGPLGAGQVAKACNQIVVASTVIALGEAAVLAEGAGLDVEQVLDALAGGYAASRILDSKRTRFTDHDHSPSGAARFMIKDLQIARDLLRGVGAENVHTQTLLDIFSGVVARGWGELDTSVVQEYISRVDGYELKV